jgi:predicted nuclease of restriction endonuclease-like RecB superfamily
MLTADLVRVRRKGGELSVRPLNDEERSRAHTLAEALLDVARQHVGRSRDELEEAWSAVPVAPRDRKLADGLKKLIDDVSEFSAQAPVEPVELRSDVFLAASAARKALAADARFDREQILGDVAARHALELAALERALYADLKGEQLLLAVGLQQPGLLVERYDGGQVQAVLLRAVRVIADVECRTPGAYRTVFRELKFRRLMHRITPRDEGGYRIEIDGPYSLFESVTKYGLGLALVFPALEACDALALVAEVRWGKQREPLAFKYQKRRGARQASEETPRLRDDVEALLQAFSGLDTPWSAAPNDEVLEVPGFGVCVPDLVFQRKGSRKKIFFEALGYWSRDAVWKRVELVKEGLATPILFAASTRLRVSEAVLDDDETAALYVYKGVMSARSVERKLEILWAKGKGSV